jgi:predicted nuclease of restriction endonuclease-like RecB superfamily
MLTVDLVRARRSGSELKVTELGSKALPRATELTREFVALAEEHVGATRSELEEAFATVEVKASEHKLALGLRKLVEDRLEFEMESELDPRELRSVLFEAAARERKALAAGLPFDRDAFLEREAQARSISSEALLRALYADLRHAQVVKSFAGVSPEQLVRSYDFAQQQAVLLRAVEVLAEVHCRDAYAYRLLFRKLKFFRLLHRIEPLADGGYRIRIDGPFSLFASATKYGLELALALPALLACDKYRIVASIRWGKERTPLTFSMEGRGRVESEAELRLPDEVEALLTRFLALKSGWDVTPASDILELPGIGLCVPDLRFVQRETGEIVYLEVLGYWSRSAVWKRVELCERGLLQRVIFALSSRLRVSEEVLGDDVPSELYVYKGTLSAREILRRLEGT